MTIADIVENHIARANEKNLAQLIAGLTSDLTALVRQQAQITTLVYPECQGALEDLVARLCPSDTIG